MARWRRRSVQWRKKKRVFQLLVISASSQRHTCAQLQSELWVSWRHPFAPFFGPQRKIFILRPLNVSMLFFGCLTRAKTWTRMLLACSPRLPWRPPPAIGASPESAGWQRHLVGVLLSDVWPVNLFPARHPTKKKITFVNDPCWLARKSPRGGTEPSTKKKKKSKWPPSNLLTPVPQRHLGTGTDSKNFVTFGCFGGDSNALYPCSL